MPYIDDEKTKGKELETNEAFNEKASEELKNMPLGYNNIFAPSYQNFYNATANKLKEVEINSFNYIKEDLDIVNEPISPKAIKNSNSLNRKGVFVPFDKQAVDFFVSSIKWTKAENNSNKAENNNSDDVNKLNIDENKLTSFVRNTFNKGFLVVYSAGKIIRETDLEPVFNVIGGKLIGFVNQDTIYLNSIIYKKDKDGKFVKNSTFKMEDYYLLTTPDRLPIWFSATSLINAYSNSLNQNEDSLTRFVESMLVLKGATNPNQKLTSQDYEEIGQSLILNLIPQLDGSGNYAPTPEVDFISPPLNTEAREAWSSRIREEIITALALPDFKNISGQVSTDTMNIFLDNSIKRATGLASKLKESLSNVFHQALTYEVITPKSQNDYMTSLVNIDYLSDKTKLELAFPDWTEQRINKELSRLSLENSDDLSPANILSALNKDENTKESSEVIINDES